MTNFSLANLTTNCSSTTFGLSELIHFFKCGGSISSIISILCPRVDWLCMITTSNRHLVDYLVHNCHMLFLPNRGSFNPSIDLTNVPTCVAPIANWAISSLKSKQGHESSYHGWCAHNIIGCLQHIWCGVGIDMPNHVVLLLFFYPFQVSILKGRKPPLHLVQFQPR